MEQQNRQRDIGKKRFWRDALPRWRWHKSSISLGTTHKQNHGKKNQPYFIGLRKRRPLAFVGLWERS
jgi:putative SOS response-associated peptidase YedK